MMRWLWLFPACLLAAAAHGDAGLPMPGATGAGASAIVCARDDAPAADTPASSAQPQTKTETQLDAEFKQFTDEVRAALGVFADIDVFERDGKTWRLAAPKDVLRAFVPVTVNGKTPAHYAKDMRSDRPMMLPTHVEGFDGGDGQSTPYSVVGRMPGSNPEVQWTFAVRQYWIKSPTDDDFPTSPDMAIIGHHPRTGASVYLQFYDPEHPKDSRVLVSPFSAGGREFYSPLDTIAGAFKCQRCHAAGPFIHTAWVNQVRISDAPDAEAMVPSAPLGPFYFLSAEPGQLFADWNDALVTSGGGGHLSPSTDNACTQCHRVTPDLLGLNQNASRYAGLAPEQRNCWSVESDVNQTPDYRELHWMPPLAAPYVDFYAGQAAFAPNWEQAFGASAAEVNRLMLTDATWHAAIARGEVADVPRPPKQYQTIVVDRPEQDDVPPGHALWILDSRMRANTDGELHQWRFFAKPGADSITAAPVIYRRVPGDGSRIEYDVRFVGAPQPAAGGDTWLPIQPDDAGFRLRQGDYLGVVFTNAGAAPGPAPIPHSKDDWARLSRNGVTWYREGSVTYRLLSEAEPNAGQRLRFDDMDFITYSFELRNRLYEGDTD
jgi:hypothetical protein